MTREEAKKNAEVMMAYAEGKTIQTVDRQTRSVVTFGPDETISFNAWNALEYRIKPEPKPPIYRPWKPEEVPVGAHIKWKTSRYSRSIIQAVNEEGSVKCVNGQYNTEELLNYCLYSLDNGKTWQPCGVLEVPSTTDDQ